MYTYRNMLESRKIIVDFGEVEVGTTAVQLLEFRNENYREQFYEARRDAITNPLDHVFELCEYSWSLSPHQVYKCKIHYQPFIPFSVDIDYFTILDSTGVSTDITVCGTCIGPVLSSSTSRLVMVSTSENSEVKKRIKLVNHSKASATFMFDIDQIQRPFRVDVKHGHIRPSSCRYITITFAPRVTGFYAYHLPCLILNYVMKRFEASLACYKCIYCDKPIIIELYGYCGPTLSNIQNRFVYPARSNSDFKEYMSDTIISANDLPVISSSKNYIDFGQTSVKMENVARKIPETLCLTNHSQSNVSIKWEQDDADIFIVTPGIAKIPANQTVLFEVVFNPNTENNLFARELGVYIFTEQNEIYKETHTFPMITSVRVMGHSFPACSDGWIPQCEIPHIIKMPPCVPSFPTYMTFLIKKFGDLPLMYHFVPPPSSHFVVKPMMGMIHQDYQIIVVGMLPDSENQRIYVERWAIQLNGNSKSNCFIDFGGFAEYADVSFNEQNIVISTPTFPGSQQLEQFSMRNITRHSIKYKFFDMPPEIRIQNIDGEIHSNDTIIHEWKFCPKTIGNYKFHINCMLNVLKDEVVIGPSQCVTLCITGRCEDGPLISALDELNFGVLAYDTTKKMSFYIFNLNPVNIHYKIICRHCNWPIENLPCDVKLHPSADTICAGQSKMITVSVTPSMPGYYEFFIQYFVRIDSDNDTLVPNDIPNDICKLRYLCILPTLKVKDLQCCGPCPDMSKVFLWKLMKINMLNKLLKNLQPGMSETLYMNFPPMILNDNPVIIKLLLGNITDITVSWNIKRVQLCSCQLVAKTKGLSFHYMRYECVHREVCSLNPRTKKIKPREEIYITLELRYILLGNTMIKWDLDLGHNRHIFLIMAIEGLSGSENKLHILNSSHFKFHQIYFGDKNPIYQICWLYNRTNNSVPFSINTKMMRKINENYHSEFFYYTTPYCGTVNPQSSVPILLKFQPRQFGIFKGRLPLILGDEEKVLTLEAECSLPHKAKTIDEYISFDDYSSKLDDIPVYFNTDCIDVSNIATHNHVVKMLMMHNNLKHDVLAYEWKRHEIPEIICVEIHPQKGLIKPMTVQTFYVTIKTERYPCMINVNIPCKFVNCKQRQTYQRSVYKHKILSEELKGKFTITNKGISAPKSWITILKKPQAFYKVITIRCSIYNPEDKCLKINLIEELISAPPDKMSIEENRKQITFNKKEITLSSFILEELLWDIIHSKLFKSLMQDILHDELDLHYSQFTMNSYERKKLIRRSYISPPRAMINRILEKMLFIITHEKFALETIHLFEHIDIRHVQKI